MCNNFHGPHQCLLTFQIQAESTQIATLCPRLRGATLKRVKRVCDLTEPCHRVAHVNGQSHATLSCTARPVSAWTQRMKQRARWSATIACHSHSCVQLQIKTMETYGKPHPQPHTDATMCRSCAPALNYHELCMCKRTYIQNPV